MKIKHDFSLVSPFIILLFLLVASCYEARYKEAGDPTTYYFAVEINGSLCGYSEVTKTPVVRDGERLILLNNSTQISMELMGKPILSTLEITSLVDSASLRPVLNEARVTQGNVHLHLRSTIKDNVVLLENVPEESTTRMTLPEGTIVDNILYYPYLVEDFYQTGNVAKTYAVLNEREGQIDSVEFTFEGMDSLFLAGEEWTCMRFYQFNRGDGLNGLCWIDPATGLMLRLKIPGAGRDIYLSDYRVKQMASTAAIDELLFYPVGEVIPDFKKLTYMKVKVEIQSVGELLDPTVLNYPGQKFEGAVEDNHVTGTFEMAPGKYHGEGAPAFPYDADLPEGLKKYLKPGELIESEDIEIAHYARLTTKDAADAWDAAVRLSRWVSDNISGALPGGGSARGSLKLRQAECGGHSRLLAAMCRAAGIPARLAIGCMYVPDNGGFFGQHMWTEVYMGPAGWVPVDATIGEVDYIDAGHIRLGESSSFFPVKMEIVEYRTGEE